MGGEWGAKRFETLLSEPLRNGIYKKKEFHGRGAKIVNMGELFGHSRMFDIKMKRVELKASEIPKVLLNSGDLLFARRSLTAEGAGKCSIVKSVSEHTTFESSIIRARPDSDIADSDYLYYVFNSPIGKYLLGTITRQVAVAGITGSDLKQLELPYPTLNTQKAIAHILGSLDDKIELNRRMNQTLEAMAQALFKSWFVDFDPVIDNALAAGNPIPEALQARAQTREQVRGDGATELPASVRALFPGEFEFTDEMGWVPKGWSFTSMADLIELIGGGTPKTSVEEYWNGEIPWFSVVDAPSDSDIFVFSTEKHVTQLGLSHSSAKLLRKGATIVSARGTVGKCAMVGKAMAMNQSCYGVVGQPGISDEYVYYLLRWQVSNLQRRSHGSVFSTITRDTFQSIRLAFCGAPLTLSFSELVQPLFTKILANGLQNVELSKLRDTLLPKLISGELRIPDAEKLVAEAGL